MQLNVKDVAQLCDVSEKRVFHWMQVDGLPTEQIDGTYRVNPAELLEWATGQNLPVSPSIFRKLNGDSLGPSGLTAALKIGGVIHNVTGNDCESVFRALIDTLSLPDGLGPDVLLPMLIAREQMGSTAIGGGIAIPHPRRPVIFPGASNVARLGFLETPIDISAPDGQPVDTLFLLIASTARVHLQLLAHLSCILRDDNFCRSLRDKPSQEIILREVQRIELSFQESS